MDAVAAFAGTCSSKCMRPLLYHEQSCDHGECTKKCHLIITKYFCSICCHFGSGWITLGSLLWMNTDTLVHVVARQSEMLSFSTKLHICLADLCGYWVTIWPVVIYIILPDVASIHGWSAMGRDFSHNGAVTVFKVCYQGYQMQCAHRTHSHSKNRLREHELVLVALLVFCASLGSWLHVSFLSFLRLLSSFLPSLGCWGSGHVWDCLKTLILFLLGIGCWLLFQRLWIWLWVAKHGVNARRVARRASPLLCLVCALGTCGGGLQKNSILSEGRGFYFNCVFGFLNVFRWWGRLLVWINASVWCARRLEGP